ncbi:Inosine-uridine nucleoside N-ribohydrolase, partial [Xenococcus sp. PCC 7305]|uniref:cellulase family glycosylhydrolase n=1 Tax=Xenococcus sp. PCC 7305 TaxID=102125 RepID=UPI0002ABDA77
PPVVEPPVVEPPVVEPPVVETPVEPPVVEPPVEPPVVEPPVEPTSDGEIDVEIKIDPWSHNSGATVHLEVENVGESEISGAEIKFRSDFAIKDLDTDIWSASIVSETTIDGQYEYVLDLDGNEDLAPGEKHSFGFNTLDATPEFEYITLNDGSTPPTPPVVEPPVVEPPVVEPPVVEPNPNPGSNKGVQLIFDTDMSNDVDDVAALAMIHALANNGEANLRAVVTNANSIFPRTASTVDVINTYYNRPDIPIGVTKLSGLKQDGTWYGGNMHKMFPHDTPEDSQVEDSVDVLRATLAAAEDNSITYVSVGYLINMASLLRSGPDEHSDLTGMELVEQKVKEAVIMGGQYPHSGKEFNFAESRPQDTQLVVDTWPTRIVFSGAEIGYKMYSGTSLQNAPDSNPVKYAHEVFRGFDTPNNAITDGYHTWDQTAVLWAVRGDEDLWRRVDNGFNQVHSDGSSQWQTWRDDSRQEYLVKTKDNSHYVNIVNDLYLSPPLDNPVVEPPVVEPPVVEPPVVEPPVVEPPVVEPPVVEPPAPTTGDGEVSRPDYNQSTGFFTLNGKVYDANGNEFIARGVNNRHVWFDSWGQTPALDSLDNIADFGFNSVRIVWEVDHKDGSLTNDSILERIIQTTIDNKMVPMVELHDFTGSNNNSDLLNRGVKWWTDRSAMWEKYEESLMINIANEFGDWYYAQGSSRAEFPKVYKEAITRIRNAGIDNTLVIDSFRYGKEASLIAEYGQEIYDHDPQKNVVFSVHFYCGGGDDPNQIAEAFDSITGQGLPMVVGEFGPTHPPCGDVRDDVIMAEAQEHGVGYYPWAWDDGEWALVANRNWEADSYNELTQFGKDVIYGPNGIEETSEIATIFEDF